MSAQPFTSQKQIESNRRNAQKSTGPKTACGKRRVSQNAATHGLTAARVLPDNDDVRRFNKFASGMLRDLAPVGRIEAVLADRIIALTWRLYRAEWMESGVMNILQGIAKSDDGNHYIYTKQITDELLKAIRDRSHHQFERACVSIDYIQKVLPEVRKTLPPPKNKLGKMAIEDFGKAAVLERLLRYQAQIERSLYRAMIELEKLQYIRKRNDAIEADAYDTGQAPSSAPQTLAPAKSQMQTPLLPAPDPHLQTADLKINPVKSAKSVHCEKTKQTQS